MKQNINKNGNAGAAENTRKNSFLTMFVCIFLAIVLVFGIVVGAIVMLRDSRACAKYDGVMVDEGVTVYLASRYKTLYLQSLTSSGVNAMDSPVFWAKDAGDGKTYGELFNEGLKEYVASVIVGNHIFESYSSYTAEDAMVVARTIEEILELKAGGSVAEFNRLTERFGFEYTDFELATEMMYKAQKAQSLVYGADGTNLKNFPEQCEEYLGKYVHVSLLFLRDSTKLVKDDNGIVDEVPLTDDEKATRRETARILREAIEARRTESADEGWITPEMFELYLKSSDGDSEMYSKGYYFRIGASATAEFASEYPEIVEAALSLEMGEYAEADCNIGTCFIYRYEPKEGAYSDSNNLFFSDFYVDASDYFYTETLRELSVLVEFTELYYAIDTVAVPKNYEFYVKSWKK